MVLKIRPLEKSESKAVIERAKGPRIDSETREMAGEVSGEGLG